MYFAETSTGHYWPDVRIPGHSGWNQDTLSSPKHSPQTLLNTASQFPFVTNPSSGASQFGTDFSTLWARPTGRGQVRRHRCHMCDKMFRTPHELARHMRTHTGEKPYQCNICSRAFNRKFILQNHLMTQHGIPRKLVVDRN